MTKTVRFLWASTLLLCASHALGQLVNQEPVAVVELGGAVGYDLKGGGSCGGPTAAVEFTPVENWLELEGGMTGLIGSGSKELDADLLFKKPWTLSRKVEFMAGVGPEWIHTSEGKTTSNAAGVEAALDFMFWPSKGRRFGWYLEPAYDYSFGRGHEQSVGASGGLLIAIPRRAMRGREIDPRAH